MALVQANESLHPVRSHFTMKYCIYFLSATPLKIQQKRSCKGKSAPFLVDITWNIYEIGYGFFLSIIYHQWITLLSKPTYKGITIQGAIYNPYPPWGGFQRWLAYIFPSVRWKGRLFSLAYKSNLGKTCKFLTRKCIFWTYLGKDNSNYLDRGVFLWNNPAICV